MPLDVALVTLSRASGVEIVSAEPGLRAVRTHAVNRAPSAAAALSGLLRGTAYRAVAVGSHGFRIVRVAVAMPAGRASRPVARAPAAAIAAGDVVVTASKQRQTLLRYPGSIVMLSGDAGSLPVGGDLGDLAGRLPVLQGTALGPGRDKLFIRGIADSSFNGTAQSTASIYLDDVQLGYSGPDPGLKLVDMREIDVLEGPQGTLYGAGGIGGIVRLTSNPVDLDRSGGSVTGGAIATLGGALGGELSAVANAPLVPGRLGLRLVGYRTRDGGYVDDPGRDRSDVNRVDTSGARVALLLDAGNRWSVELAGLAQRIDAQDAPYADTRVGPLARASLLAQPFANSLALGRLEIGKSWSSGLQLVSASGVVANATRDRFDASGAGSIARSYQLSGSKLLASHETRLSRSLPDGTSWVVGFSLLRDRDTLARALGAPDGEVAIIGVTNLTRSASAFGQVTHGVTRALQVTLGSRLTVARTDGDPSTAPRAGSYVKGRSTRRLDPTLAFSWQIAPDLALFGHGQSGYRTGGIAVARGIGRVADFRSDSIVFGELGLRKLRGGTTGLAASASVSLAHWVNIQADLVDRRGQPYTANIGNARIQTAEANLDWVPMAGLHATGAFLLTHNVVQGSLAGLTAAANRRLPETPAIAARATLAYEWSVRGQATYRLGASAGYVGPSVLGVGDLLDVRQGDYATAGLSAGARWGRTEVSADLDNLSNTDGNRFAYGNPFLLARRSLSTPLRPLNLAIRVTRHW